VRTVELAPPGSLRQVLDWIAMLDAVPFDPDRSPWDATSIRGLGDGKGALFLRAHHVLTDGLGGTRLLRDIFDPPERSADGAGTEGPSRGADAPSDGVSAPRSIARPGTITIDLTRAVHTWAVGVDRARSARPVGVAVRGFQRALDVANSVSRQVMVLGGPLSPMPPARSVVSRFDVVSAPNVREVAIGLGGSRNDLLVVAAAAALGSYFDQTGQECPKVRVAVPVRQSRHGEKGGNWFAPSRVDVPSAPAHPLRQFAIVSERLAQARREPALRFTGALATAMSRLPDRVLLPAVNAQADSIDLTVTTLPGLRGSASICGAKIEALYPIGPRLGRPLNVTAFATADGGLDIGIALDPMAITDAERFRECMLETMGRMAQTAASVPVAEAAAREPCPDPSPTADPR
jgi:hypothetical protein